MARWLIIILLVFIHQPVWAKLVLSAPPRENPEIGKQYYGPIAEGISKLLGTDVVYEHPKNWIQYANNMRSGRYDIVFDGPHFVAWRMKHIKHRPLARLTGSLRFLVLAKKQDKHTNSMRDLIGNGLCGLASPNLGTVAAFDLYQNPVVQPQIKTIRGGMRKVMQSFLNGQCRAAIVRDKVYDKLPAEKKQTIKIIASSKTMPNQAISVGDRIPASASQKIMDYLTSPQGFAAAEKLLQRYSAKKKVFIPASSQEFNGLETLLEGIVFGW